VAAVGQNFSGYAGLVHILLQDTGLVVLAGDEDEVVLVNIKNKIIYN
jgi:hypothetical protein